MTLIPYNQVQVDLLNHSTLPFLDRETDLGRLMSYWRDDASSRAFEVMMVTGEALIGKSWLLDELKRRIFSVPGIRDNKVRNLSRVKERFVHVKFRAGLDNALVPLLARALGKPLADRDRGQGRVEPTLGAVVAGLQSMTEQKCRVLLVLEDLDRLWGGPFPSAEHLGDELAELKRVLDAVKDEAIAVLVLAGPTNVTEVREMLRAYGVNEMTLAYFSREICASAWKLVFEVDPEPQVLEILYKTTIGHPLALTLALRDVLKDAMDVRIDPRRGWSVPGRIGWMERIVKHTTSELAAAFLCGLSGAEQAGICRLAQLGEVFAREAAAGILDGADGLIEALLFKGIIATTATEPNMLPGRRSDHAPLVFTHSLLPRHLMLRQVVDVGYLARVIADHPLYSVVPFQLLAERARYGGDLHGETIGRAFDRTFEALKAVDRSPSWRSASVTWRAAARLLLARLGAWSREEWERMLVKLVHHRLSLALRDHPDVLEHLLGYLAALTENPTSDEMAVGRLHVLTYRGLAYSSGRPEVTKALWDDAESMLENRPGLQYGSAYADFLIAMCMDAFGNADVPMLCCIRERTTRLLRSSQLPDAFREQFERRIFAPLLSLFETPEELQISLSRITEFESYVEENDFNVWTYCITLLAEVAEVERLNGMCDSVLPLMLEQGAIDPYVENVARRLMVRAGACVRFDSIVAQFEVARANMEPRRWAEIGSMLALPLLDAALLGGRSWEAVQIMNAYRIGLANLGTLQRIVLALDKPGPLLRLDEAIDMIRVTSNGIDGETEILGILDFFGDAINSLDLDLILRIRRRPVLRLTDVLRLHILVRLYCLAQSEGVPHAVSADLEEALCDVMERTLKWLEDRKLFVFMSGLLSSGEYDRDFKLMNPLFVDGRHLLATASKKRWDKKLKRLTEMGKRDLTLHEMGKWRVTMIGKIAITTPLGVCSEVKGDRAGHVLAAMVLSPLQARSFSEREFFELAVGAENAHPPRDLEDMRNVVKNAISKLRDRFGFTMILTGRNSLPLLNPDAVDVDIWNVGRNLDLCDGALLDGAPARAQMAYLNAISTVLVDGLDAPFRLVLLPRGKRLRIFFRKLYDDTFERFREQFGPEQRVRGLALVRALSEAGMHDDAAYVLRILEYAFPSDEE